MATPNFSSPLPEMRDAALKMLPPPKKKCCPYCPGLALPWGQRTAAATQTGHSHTAVCTEVKLGS